MEKEYKLAEQYHLQGNNCIESVLKTCNDTMNLQLPDVAIRMASGMGGGIGRSGCVCGALSGACLVIGALVGRLTPDEKPLPEVYKYTSEFHDRFKITKNTRGSAPPFFICSPGPQHPTSVFGTPEYRKKSTASRLRPLPPTWSPDWIKRYRRREPHLLK